MENGPSNREFSALQKDFMYMKALQRAYFHPFYLLKSSNIPIDRRKFLLKRWRDDRMRFLLENCRDMDFMQDAEMERVLQALYELKKSPEAHL